MSVKVVAIGDSLTQGFKSGSITRTDLAYPSLIAQCLGETQFKTPDFSGAGGLPFNMEALLRVLAQRYGSRVDWYEFAPMVQTVQSYMDKVEDYWERGDGTKTTATGPLHHNLAVWGFQIADSHTISEQISRTLIDRPNDDLVNQIPEFAQYRTARRTLNPTFAPQYQHLTQIGVAQKLAQEQGGIDNLIFWLGANHCLSTVVGLKMQWSDHRELEKLPHQRTANIWKPEHFKIVFDRAMDELAKVGANNVFVANVPHVTIPPVSRGITPGAKAGEGQDAEGYYEYYTHFWIWDSNFNPERHPYLTRSQIRQIDQTIDEYNEIIREKVTSLGFHVVDICDLLDRLAFRRQQGQVTYQFPSELIAALRANPQTQNRVSADGRVLLDTRYPRLDLNQNDPLLKYRGGLFSLDGIHPGAIAYGLVADEFLKVMQQVWQSKGQQVNLKPLNWAKLVKEDTLVNDPPANLAYLQDTLGFLYSQTPVPELFRLLGVSLG